MREARSPVLTWVRDASVCSEAAVFTGEAQRTGAGVVVYAINAGSGVLTRIASAVVDVGLAPGAGETRTAATQSASTQIYTLATYNKRDNRVALDERLPIILRLCWIKCCFVYSHFGYQFMIKSNISSISPLAHGL